MNAEASGHPSHLRFGDTPIRSTYLIDSADFIACHNPSYVTKYDMVSALKVGGVFLLNCPWSAEELETELPASMKRKLAEKKARFYTIDAISLAASVGMGNRINTIMQAAFFKLADIISYEKADEYMKAYAKKSYGKKGDAIVKMNWDAIDVAISGLKEVKVPEAWLNATTGAEPVKVEATEYFNTVVSPILAQEGDKLPVSAFSVDGSVPTGTTKYEKRGIAVKVPEWDITKCIQCGNCSLVCPHAAIRPYLATEETLKNAPASFETKPALGPKFKGLQYRMQVSVLDCTGCENCVTVCPAKEKALVMRPLEEQMPQQKNWDYITKHIGYKQVVDKTKSVKNLQFAQPLFEFSGACAGCGETPYIKAISQLFGDKMMVANATGCTSIYSGSAPSTPYCTNDKGQGPAWANSLFEDNAEFGLGMHLGVEKLRDRIQNTMEQAIANCTKCSDELKGVMQEWIASRGSSAKSAEVSARLVPMMEACGCDYCKDILEMKDWLVKKSQWIIGGDGWGYDIGYGGVDHVLATGQDVNILVVDTEVYSNTGGQSSKSTPVGAVAKFASSGKRIRKKDLGLMQTTYGYIYVAQIAMGADNAQTLKAIREAEAYPGPSLIIAYAPCINHGIKGTAKDRRNMGRSQHEEALAVECGYWHLWRYNPNNAKEGKNPFTLDSKEPQWDKFQEYLMGEVRFASLKKAFKDEADELFAETEKSAKRRYQSYLRKSQEDWSDII